MKFYEKIKKIRVDNNLTQEEMANKLFVSRSLIAKWEQNRGIPSIDMLNNIAATFGLAVNDLITEEEIKCITLKNNQEVEHNKKHLKITIIVGAISILILTFVILFIIGRVNRINNEKPIFQDFSTRGEIVKIESDKVIVSDSLNQYEVVWNQLKFKLDRYGNEINYDFLKKGYYVKLSGMYNVTHKEYSFEKLIVIEEYLDDYVIYGFVITLNDTSPTSIPLWGTSWDNNDRFDKPSDDEYPYYIIALGSDYNQTLVVHNYFADYHYDFLQNDNGVVSIDIELVIRVLLNKKVNIFVIDNSEKGFTLVQSVEPQLFSKTTKIDVSGYVISEKLKNSKDVKYPSYSTKMNYQLNIVHEYSPKQYIIYEYDANNQLVKETNFSILGEFKNKFKGVQEETIYCIIKKVGPEISSKQVYLGERYSFELVDEFGYIYKFDHTLN